MKIILSRKGFDSQYGKIKSPILENGTLLSLPIPQENDTKTFDDLWYGDKPYKNKTYNEIIKELKPNWQYPAIKNQELYQLRINKLSILIQIFEKKH